jgi:hypothetical protein
LNRYYACTVETLDPGREWSRLSDHYRQMTDEELLALNEQKSELSEVAQQALAQELSGRRLKPGKAAAVVPIPETSDSPYADDRELAELCTVWSLADAAQLASLLDRSGIPFFIGPEKATSVREVTSSFAGGLNVQVMRIGWPWASQAMRHYQPVDAPRSEQTEGELEIYCPKCHSSEVIFEGLNSENKTGAAQASDRKYQWTCGECDYQWEDEGIAR